MSWYGESPKSSVNKHDANNHKSADDSYAIYALTLLGIAVAGSGCAYADVGGEWLEGAHGALSYAMLGVVGIHVTEVVASSKYH